MPKNRPDDAFAQQFWAEISCAISVGILGVTATEPLKIRIPAIGYSAIFERSHPFSNRGRMNLDQNSPDICGTRTRDVFSAGKQAVSRIISKDFVLDVIERAIVLILFLYFANKMLPRFAGLITTEIAHPELLWVAASTNLQAVLLVVSESLGVFLILTRRFATTASTRLLDWALSFAAVNAPLLAGPAAPSTFVPSEIATAVMIAGMIIQISAKAALWRSYGLIPANRGVKTRGPYRLVRHPMYAGYTLTHIGFLLGFPSLQNSLLYFTTFLIEVARLMREELILRKDPLYRDYATRVPRRLIPGIF
jgi:protein-S-isoprenylcysteine O-methyltransferase Ste14